MEENKEHNIEVPEEEVSAVREFPVSFSIFSMARSHRGLAAQLLREAGLYPGQEIVLMQLWHRDHRSQNSLCRSTRLDHSTIAKSVRRLEDAGLVVSSRSKEDKRVTIVSLTQAGRDIELRVNDAWSKVEALTTEALTEDEQMTFVTLARKIAASLEAAEE
ncbi:MarR family winged helix-turn-helix transcriptional regulator [Paenibacillus sp. XY044]|uniref:MarR family winged helix-turn-helix transcriptional regulator n=1 Tax=Paenibacillus sp. XY044 TaxID=2026089 RepID=UPI000B987036|nr:MarR family winged helix-turn-helix transcriptional regulator [Paenibacillus sp. XY044]OZB95321.1 MarR family transcriptional regulator [Paenibacillus sp. XY044]